MPKPSANSSSRRPNSDSAHGSISSQQTEIAPTATSTPEGPTTRSREQRRPPKRYRSSSPDSDVTSTVSAKKQAMQQSKAVKVVPANIVDADRADLQKSVDSQAASLTPPDTEFTEIFRQYVEKKASGLMDSRFKELSTRIYKCLNIELEGSVEKRVGGAFREATPSALPLIFPALDEKINSVEAELARVTVKQRQDFEAELARVTAKQRQDFEAELARVTEKQSKDFDNILATCQSNTERIEKDIRQRNGEVDQKLEHHSSELFQLSWDIKQNLTEDKVNSIVDNILKKATRDDLPGISTRSNERMENVETFVNTLKAQILRMRGDIESQKVDWNGQKQSISSIQSEHRGLKDDVKVEIGSILQLFEHVKSRIEELEKTEKEQTAPLKDTVGKLSGLVGRSQSEKAQEELSEAVKTLQEKNDALTMRVEEQSRTAQETTKTLQEKNDVFTKLIERRNKKAQELSKAVKTLQEKNDALTKRVEGQVKEAHKELSKTIKTLKEKDNTLAERIERQSEKVQEELSEAVKTLQEKDDALAERIERQSKETQEELFETIKTLQEKNNALITRIERQSNETQEELSKTIKTLQEKDDALIERIERQSEKAQEELSETVKTLQEKDDALTTRIASQSIQMDEVNTRIESISTRLTHVKDGFETRNKDFQAHIASLKDLKAQQTNSNDALIKLIKEQSMQMDEVDARIESISTRLMHVKDDSEARNKDFQAHIASLKDLKAQQTDSNDALTKLIKKQSMRMDEVDTRIESTSTRLTHVKDDFETRLAKQAIPQRANAAQESLRDHVDQNSSRLDVLEVDVRNQRRRLEAFDLNQFEENSNAALKKAIADMDKKCSDPIDLRKEVEEMRKRQQNTFAAIKILRDDVKSLKESPN